MPPTRSSTTKVTPLLEYASPNPRDWRSPRGARERPVNLCVRDGFKAFEGPGLNSLRICESLREPLRSLQSVSAHTSDATSTSGDDSDDARLGKQILSVYVTPGFTRILGNPPEFTRSTYAAGDGNHVPGTFTTLRCPVNSPPPPPDPLWFPRPHWRKRRVRELIFRCESVHTRLLAEFECWTAGASSPAPHVPPQSHGLQNCSTCPDGTHLAILLTDGRVS